MLDRAYLLLLRRLIVVHFAALLITGCRTEKLAGVYVPLQGYDLYALGVADLDGDGRVDLYAINHNARPTLLRSTGDIRKPFEELPALSHDLRFPALVDLAEQPDKPELGALVYWFRKAFFIDAGQLREPVSGTVTFRTQPVIKTTTAANVRVARLDDTRWAVDFTIESGGQMATWHVPQSAAGWPVTLALDSDPSDVSIGRQGDHPDRTTTFRLRDYHALAVRDVNDDGRPDIVALGGGLRGRGADLAPDATETLFLADGDSFAAVPGPPKAGCATRFAWWEGDALRVLCARGHHDNTWTWVRDNTSPHDPGEWRGGPVDVTTKGTVAQRHGCSSATLVAANQLKLPAGALCAEADFDGDGDLELVVAIPGRDSMYTALLYDADEGN